MAAVSNDEYYNAVPALGVSAFVFTYTKANTGDYLDISSYCPIKTILWAKAQTDTAGADDPLTWSGTTITFSAGTGAGRVLVVGRC